MGPGGPGGGPDKVELGSVQTQKQKDRVGAPARRLPRRPPRGGGAALRGGGGQGRILSVVVLLQSSFRVSCLCSFVCSLFSCMLIFVSL